MLIGATFSRSRGSALQCGSVQDYLQACSVLIAAEKGQGKALAIRIVSILTKLG
jgi:hypothetical protein